MPLPTRANVQTLDYTLGAQPAAVLEAKALSPSSATLDYTLAAQPAVGLLSGVAPTNYFITAFNGTYSVTGQSSNISFGRLLSAQNGVYSVAGQTVDISVGIPPTPITAIEYFVEIRSFTERRRF